MENWTNSLVDTTVRAAEALLNCKDAIQTMPSLTVALRKKFVGAQNCKKGMYECAVYSDHVTCAYSCYKFKKLCEHSLSIAEKTGMIKEHLHFLRKTLRRKAPSFFLPSALLCQNGIHLNKAGNYALYRSYRGEVSNFFWGSVTDSNFSIQSCILHSLYLSFVTDTSFIRYCIYFMGRFLFLTSGTLTCSLRSLQKS